MGLAGPGHHHIWLSKQYLQHQSLPQCAYCNSLISNVKLKSKETLPFKKRNQLRINASKTINPDKNQKFIERLVENLPNDSSQCMKNSWYCLWNTIYNATVSIYGKKIHKNKNWFKANISTFELVIKAKHSMLIRLKYLPTQQNLQTLKLLTLIPRKLHIDVLMTIGSNC